MIVCDYCKRPIMSRYYFKKWRNGERVFVCERCAYGLINERTINGLVLVIGDKK